MRDGWKRVRLNRNEVEIVVRNIGPLPVVQNSRAMETITETFYPYKAALPGHWRLCLATSIQNNSFFITSRVAPRAETVASYQGKPSLKAMLHIALPRPLSFKFDIKATTAL